MATPHTGKFIAYYRVSTDRQGRSGLGLEAQRQAVHDFLNGGDWQLVREFTEIESGRKTDRPVLKEAIDWCFAHQAKLVIAKLDRLARNASFLLTLRDSGIDFVCADMPDANRLTVGILALVAEDEAIRISQRTKAALAAAKARGVKLGNPHGFTKPVKSTGPAANKKKADKRAQELAHVVERLQAEGLSLSAMAERLNEMGIPTARGGSWHASTVRNVIQRLNSKAGA